MYGDHASGHLPIQRLQSAGVADTAAIVAFQPLSLDTGKAAAASSSQGITIGDPHAVSSFVRTPTSATGRLFLGVSPEAAGQGQVVNPIVWGPAKVRVRNANAASISLAIGDPLMQSPGNDYLLPAYLTAAAGGSVAPGLNAARAIAIVRKAITIAATTTSEVEVWLFPYGAPRLRSINYILAGANTTNLVIPLGITQGPFIVAAAGFGLEVCGSAGLATLDVTIDTVSIFTTTPKIANDGADTVHTLKNTAAADVGTGGSYGTINAAASSGVARQKLGATVTYSSSPSGQSGLNVQVDLLEF